MSGVTCTCAHIPMHTPTSTHMHVFSRSYLWSHDNFPNQPCLSHQLQLWLTHEAFMQNLPCEGDNTISLINCPGTLCQFHNVLFWINVMFVRHVYVAAWADRPRGTEHVQGCCDPGAASAYITPVCSTQNYWHWDFYPLLQYVARAF